VFTNGSATLYHDTGDGYTKTYFPAVFWQNLASVNTGRDGLVNQFSERLIIPTTEEITVTTKDFFIKGAGPDIDNTSEATIAAGLKSLGKVHSVAAISEKLYGSAYAQHYEFSLR